MRIWCHTHTLQCFSIEVNSGIGHTGQQQVCLFILHKYMQTQGLCQAVFSFTCLSLMLICFGVNLVQFISVKSLWLRRLETVLKNNLQWVIPMNRQTMGRKRTVWNDIAFTGLEHWKISLFFCKKSRRHNSYKYSMQVWHQKYIQTSVINFSLIIWN